MGSELQSVLIDDAVELIIDHRGRTPKKLGGDFSSSGVQVVSAKHVYDGRLHLDKNRRFVRPEMAKRWMPMKLRQGDVLLTSEAPLGEVAYLSVDTDICLGQRVFALRARSALVDGRFLYYTLRSPLVQSRLYARATGTTAQGIKQSELRHVKLDMPPVAEQARIAAVLGTLDDKIDSNRRLASLLEEIASALFVARFVDYVGVEDFEESEIGPIPASWNVMPIGQILKIVGGATPSTKEPNYWEGGTHGWATPKDLSGHDSPVLLDTARRVTDAGVKRISSGVLPPETVLLSSRAPVGYTVISKIPIAVNQGFIAVPPSGDIPSEYVLFWLRHNMDTIKSNAGGTTFAEISKRDFRPIPMLVPPKQQLNEFALVVRPMFSLIAGLDRERLALVAVRDALLPKLVSGDIRVSGATDIEDVIGTAAGQLAGGKA